MGVKGVQFPLIIAEKPPAGGELVNLVDEHTKYQHTVAIVDMFVALPHHFKGTHMSRFLEILNEYRNTVININVVKDILRKIANRLEAGRAIIVLSFPYFIEKEAPVSKKKSLMNYQCKFIGRYDDEDYEFIIEVEVPITTLCPCSKGISSVGAHNQRSFVRIQFKFSEFVWIEDIIRVAEECASSEIYPLLKREDEKYITERMYEHPCFVEDIVRSISQRLDRIDAITWYSVESENMESIHNHNAYGKIEKTK